MFYVDREALDSVPFTKESEHTGMSYMSGSPMNEDDDKDSADENIDEDIHSPDRDSYDMEGDVDDAATGRGDSNEDEGDKSLEESDDGPGASDSEHVGVTLDQLHGDSDEELAGEDEAPGVLLTCRASPAVSPHWSGYPAYTVCKL
jgi:hypothetical protein